VSPYRITLEFNTDDDAAVTPLFDMLTREVPAQKATLDRIDALGRPSYDAALEIDALKARLHEIELRASAGIDPETIRPPTT
jgi:hypothetical protein